MAQDVIRSYKTKGVKELQTFIKPGTSHYILQWSDGGQLPAELSGMYTSVNTVDTAVFNYINTQKEAKVEQTAKEKYYAKQEKKSQEI
jgi:hypothetical protein|tara:strand:- start:231 stop:494 length:264 start_codon:yes stop_codon:yes gene_type:complete